MDSRLTGPAVRLRAATPADWPLLQTWLVRPDVERWWGSRGAAEAEIRIVFETQSAIARIIEADGRPAGYAHAIDATFWGPSLPDGMPPGTWDVDVVIAEPEFRSRGVGAQALEEIAREVFQTTFALALSVFVPLRTEAAVRAYERAGFRWVEVWNDPLLGPCWLMIRPRP
ncbi:MAG: GNAT family N-acetyltransferase [Hyphomicrobiaceae bacterium]|nr:GNAT family N-acetyltransferase [Hyphomicrobiaceae bacterium]